MEILDEIITANDAFVAHLPVEFAEADSTLSKLPRRRMAIVTCMDTRLVDFLEPALGIVRGEAKVIKNAGNTVTGPFESTIRSLIVAVFELGVEEILVIGHHDCGVAHTTSDSLIEKMLKRGISKDAIKMIEAELVDWVDKFHHPIENVKHVVAKIHANPLIPEEVPVHGLIFDPKTGKVDLVVDGYRNMNK